MLDFINEHPQIIPLGFFALGAVYAVASAFGHYVAAISALLQ